MMVRETERYRYNHRIMATSDAEREPPNADPRGAGRRVRTSLIPPWVPFDILDAAISTCLR